MRELPVCIPAIDDLGFRLPFKGTDVLPLGSTLSRGSLPDPCLFREKPPPGPFTSLNPTPALDPDGVHDQLDVLKLAVVKGGMIPVISQLKGPA